MDHSSSTSQPQQQQQQPPPQSTTAQADDVDAFAYRPSEPEKASSSAASDELVRARSGSPFVGYGQEDSTSEELDSLSSNEWFLPKMTECFRTNVVQGLYIGIFAIFGSFLRMVTAQFFGEECNNPGTVGWLASGSPLCVTSSGGATEQGGIIFADLPANMLGSFVMGLFASCGTLRLAVSTMNIAWLKPTNAFQRMPILHKAITTGFCGSLTTFSGWNSSMVVLLFGTGSSRSTHVANAIFGYIIGMEVAIGCYCAGKSLARKIYRWVNPILANESDAMEVRQEEGVHLNPELPDFERRYLPDLKMNGDKDVHGDHNKYYGEVYDALRLEYLSQWRESTKQARRVNHPLLPTLVTIEKAILIQQSPVPMEAESIAHTHGWNVSALREWARSRDLDHGRLPSISSASFKPIGPKSRMFSIPFAAALLGSLLLILLFLLLSFGRDNDSYHITNRTMVYSMMFAPLGALMRWELSVMNSSVTWKGWEWFPLGTFAANLTGSVISIAAIAFEYKMKPADTNFWGVGTIRAIKVGFVGCLTTVSTFVAEIHGFIINHTDHAYPYMLTTIACCCGAASLIYGLMIYGF